MYVLGINSVYHESSACLWRDGEIVAIGEEERFNRVKHGKKPRVDNPDEFPLRAMHYCLDAANIDLGMIDHIGYSSNPALRPDDVSDGLLEFKQNIRRAPQKLQMMGFRGEFHWVDHHRAHAASTYFASPYEEAAVLSIDGIGDASTTATYHGRGRTLEPVHMVDAPHSIGFLWELTSMFLGFDIYDATKIMGLASYGDPQQFAAQFGELIQPTPDGGFRTNQNLLRFDELDYITPSGYFDGLERLFRMRRRGDGEPLTEAHQNIAAALQWTTDEILLHMIRHLHEKTGSKNLCLAGGVALNCVSNTRVFERGPFEELYIQPATHDAGTAIGCALHIAYEKCGAARGEPMTSAYHGPSFSSLEIEAALREHGLNYTRSECIEADVARILSEGKIVGFLQGRMEIGPRALGNRSLLADPRLPNMRDILNQKVKHREYFRPFAPSVLWEARHEWFQIEKETPASDFMLMAYPVPEEQQAKIPAVVHCDGTSRIQTVRRETNPRYHRLISEFQKLTGVPIVLNTSFNDSEPIVCTPSDAIQTFLKTNIDYLAMGDFLVSKEENRKVRRPAGRLTAAPIHRTQPELYGQMVRALTGKWTARMREIHIVTDDLECEHADQVQPLYPELQFFIDQLDIAKLKGARVLEIDSSSGVISIACCKAGARQVVALERSGRAKAMTGFNAVLNGCEDRIELRDGNADVYRAVAGERFDWIVSNPPLAPMAGESGAGMSVAGGLLALEAVERILAGLDEHLAANGSALLVTVAPGDEREPHLLGALAKRLLAGKTTITVNPEPNPVDYWLSFLEMSEVISPEDARELAARAEDMGASHLHLCTLHYAKGDARELVMRRSERFYPNWYAPVGGVSQV